MYSIIVNLVHISFFNILSDKISISILPVQNLDRLWTYPIVYNTRIDLMQLNRSKCGLIKRKKRMNVTKKEKKKRRGKRRKKSTRYQYTQEKKKYLRRTVNFPAIIGYHSVRHYWPPLKTDFSLTLVFVMLSARKSYINP